MLSLANPCLSSVAALNARPQQREFVDFETRELDELQLDARDPKFLGFLGKAAKKVAGLVLREDENGEYYVAREYDDIDAREPMSIGEVTHLIKCRIRPSSCTSD